MRFILPRLARTALHSSLRAKPASLTSLRPSSYQRLNIRGYSDKAAADRPVVDQPVNTFEDEPEREWSTPLAKQLADAIGVSEAITYETKNP